MFRQLLTIIGFIAVIMYASDTLCKDRNKVEFRFEGEYVPEILVKARIVAVKETKKDYFSNTAIIAHVFKGTSDLLRTKFIFKSNYAEGSHTADEILYPFKVGNVFIIAIKRNAGQLVPDRRDELNSFLAIKETVKPIDYYSCILKVAQAIETIAGAESDKRLGLTKEYLSSTDFFVSEFAANVICSAKPDAWLQYFAETQAAGKLGLGAEMVYAEIMFRENPTLWRVSEPRRVMMKKWVSEKYSEYEFDRISHKLSSYFGWRMIPDEEYIAYVRIAVQNDSMSDRALKTFIMKLKEALKRPDIETVTFDLLVKLIREGKQENKRRPASNAILSATRKRGHSEPVKYSDAQVSIIKTLVSVEKDEKVKMNLLKAIENSVDLPTDSDEERR